MRYALFLGCLIPYRVQGYEISARKILPELGIELTDLDFGCCGSQILESYDYKKWLTVGARNLALAEEHNLDILTLCGSCTSTLKRINHILKEDKELKDKINVNLGKVGRRFHGDIKVVHITHLLADLLPEIKSHVKKNLNLRVAIQYPCQVSLKFMNFDRNKIKEIVSLTGVTIKEIKNCCGATLHPFNEDISLKILEENLKDLEVDYIITECPNCQVAYEVYQSMLNSEIPSITITQLLGLVIGHQPGDLGLEQNRVRLDSKIFE